MNNCNCISSKQLFQIFEKGEKSLKIFFSFPSTDDKEKIEKNPCLLVFPLINYNQRNKYADLLKSKLRAMNSNL